MRARIILASAPLLALSLAFAITRGAGAAEEDLSQTVTDLTAQTDDKGRLDTLGAVKIELSQTRSWLGEAQNAIKEKKDKQCRKLFERIRSQLKLIDQRIVLSQLEAEASKLEQALASARKGLAAARKVLEDKRVQLKAMKITTK